MASVLLVGMPSIVVLGTSRSRASDLTHYQLIVGKKRSPLFAASGRKL